MVGQATTTTVPAGGVSASGITTTPAARAFLAHVVEASKFALAQRRPWTEMIDRNAFAKPENFSVAWTRVRQNLSYFRVNYILVLLAVVCLTLIWHPGPFFILTALLAGWGYMYMVRRDPLVLWGRTFNEKEILVIMSIFTFIGLFITDVGYLLISSLLFGIAIVAAHGAFRVPDDLFLDDQEAPGGFLSFLATGGPQPPTIVTHV